MNKWVPIFYYEYICALCVSPGQKRRYCTGAFYRVLLFVTQALSPPKETPGFKTVYGLKSARTPTSSCDPL